MQSFYSTQSLSAFSLQTLHVMTFAGLSLVDAARHLNEASAQAFSAALASGKPDAFATALAQATGDASKAAAQAISQVVGSGKSEAAAGALASSASKGLAEALCIIWHYARGLSRNMTGHPAPCSIMVVQSASDILHVLQILQQLPVLWHKLWQLPSLDQQKGLQRPLHNPSPKEEMLWPRLSVLAMLML